MASPQSGFLSTDSRSNLEMQVSVERRKLENPEKNPRSKDENQQQTQPTCDTGTGNQTWATLVGGECSHHCAIPAPIPAPQIIYAGVFYRIAQYFWEPHRGTQKCEQQVKCLHILSTKPPNKRFVIPLHFVFASSSFSIKTVKMGLQSVIP